MRPTVYIAGPISKGDLVSNIDRATRAFVELAKLGFAPFCPHWSVYSGPALVTATGGSVYALAAPQPNELTHADWLAVDLEWVRKSDAVLRLPGDSVGADMETAEALRCGIPVFTNVEALRLWAMRPEAAP